MTLSQIVAEIYAQANDLETVRRERFLAWLGRHHRTQPPFSMETLPDLLAVWLGNLPPQGLQWEARLLQDEIAWWRNLSDARLWNLSEEENSS